MTQHQPAQTNDIALTTTKFHNILLYTVTMPTHHESQKRKEEEDPPPPTAHPAKRAKTADEVLRDQCANTIPYV